jgi:drug/metabolite transporter (DMT)-like permease
LHLAVFLWGFTGVLGRVIALDEYALVIYRMIFTALILGSILLYTGQWKWIGWAAFWQLFFIGCLIAIHWVAFYGSIKKANASIALICLSTSSIYTALLGPLFTKQKFNFVEIACSILAIIGMACIYKFESNYTLGIIFGLLAAMLSAVFTLFNKKIIHQYPSQLVAFYEIGSGVGILFLLMPLYNYYFSQIRIVPSVADIGWLLILSYFCTVLGQSLALSALKKLSSFTVVLAVNLEPVYGIALAFIFYQEQKNLSAGFYYGIAIIACSVALHSVYMYRQQRKLVASG